MSDSLHIPQGFCTAYCVFIPENLQAVIFEITNCDLSGIWASNNRHVPESERPAAFARLRAIGDWAGTDEYADGDVEPPPLPLSVPYAREDRTPARSRPVAEAPRSPAQTPERRRPSAQSTRHAVERASATPAELATSPPKQRAARTTPAGPASSTATAAAGCMILTFKSPGRGSCQYRIW